MRSLITIIILLGCLATAKSQTTNPYASIAQRNIFGLVPATPEQPTNTTPTFLANIKLNGLTSIFGYKEALITTTATTNKQSYIMKVGEIQDGIECLGIDMTNSIAVFNNNGVIQKIGFDSDKHVAEPVTAVEPQPVLMPTTPEQAVLLQEQNQYRRPRNLEEARQVFQQRLRMIEAPPIPPVPDGQEQPPQ